MCRFIYFYLLLRDVNVYSQRKNDCWFYELNFPSGNNKVLSLGYAWMVLLGPATETNSCRTAGWGSEGSSV